jgi:hypothetical protein
MRAVRWCLDQDDAEGLDGKVLLMRQVRVHRDECVEDALHPAQEFTFLTPSQPSPLTVWASWPLSRPAKSTGTFSSSRTRIGQE